MVLAKSLYDAGMSVGLVSNKMGRATVIREGVMDESNILKFKEQLIYGDRVKTGQNSMLSMLLENETLVSMQEFSEIKIAQESDFLRIVHLLDGQVCVSTKKDGNPVAIKAPTVMVTVQPGSMVSVNVQQDNNEGKSPSPLPSQASLVLTSADSRLPSRHPSFSVAEQSSGNNILTKVHAHEGSASLVSQQVKKVKVDLVQKQEVRVVGYEIGVPYQGPDVPCQVQDIQKVPQHTATPKETEEGIVGDQQLQANHLVALLIPPYKYETGPQLAAPPQDPVLLPGDDPNFDNGGSVEPASPGLPVVDVSNTVANFEEPFLVGRPGVEAVNGPPFIFPVSNFSGNMSEIDPSDLFGDLPPQVASSLLSFFENPEAPGTLMAGVRVAGNEGAPANVAGGLLLQNSTVTTPVDFAIIGESGSSLPAFVQISGALLELQDSQFDTTSTFLSLRNGNFTDAGSSKPVVLAQGDSRFRVGQNFLSTNPSTMEISHSLLHLSDGAFGEIVGDLVDLQSSSLDASGAAEALVRVERESLLRVDGNFVRADQGKLDVANGLLEATNSEVMVGENFLSLEGGSVVTNGIGALLDIQGGQFGVEGSLLTADNSQAHSAGLVRAASGSVLTVSDYLVALSNNGGLTMNGAPVVNLTDSTLLARGILSVTNQTVPTPLVERLVELDSTSTLTLSQAVIRARNSTGLDLDLETVLPFASGLTGDGVVMLLENSEMLVAGDIISANGTAETVVGGGVVRAANDSVLTIQGYVAALFNQASLTTNGVPVVDLQDSTLTTRGLLKVTNQAVPTNLVGGLVNVSQGSQLQITEAVIQVMDGVGSPLNLASLLDFGPYLTNNGFVALLDNSEVMVEGDLMEATGTLAALPGAGLLRATNGSTLVVNGYVAVLSQNGNLETNEVPVVSLVDSALIANGLVRIREQSNVPLALVDELIVEEGSSTVSLKEAVVKVEMSHVSFLGEIPGLRFDAPFGLLAEQSDIEVVLVAPLESGLIDNVRLVDSSLTALVRWEFGPTIRNTEIDLIQLDGYNPFGVNVIQEEGSLLVTEISGMEISGSQGITLSGIPEFLEGSLAHIDRVDITDLAEVTLGVMDLVVANGSVTKVSEQIQVRGGSALTIPGYVAAVENGGTLMMDQPPLALVDSSFTADGLLRVRDHHSVPVAILGQLVLMNEGSTVSLSEAVVRVEHSQVDFLGELPFRQMGAPVGLLAEESTITLTTNEEEVFLDDLNLMSSQLFVQGSGDAVWEITEPGSHDLHFPDPENTSGFPIITLGDNVIQDSTSIIEALPGGPILVRVRDTIDGVVELSGALAFLEGDLPDIQGVEVQNSTVRFDDGENALGGLVEVEEESVTVVNQIQANDSSTLNVPGFVAAIAGKGTLSIEQPPLALDDSTLAAAGLLTIGPDVNVSTPFLSQLVSVKGASSIQIENALVEVNGLKGDAQLRSQGSLLPGSDTLVSALDFGPDGKVLRINDGKVFVHGNVVELVNIDLSVPGGVLEATTNAEVTVDEYVVSLAGGSDFSTGSSPLVRLVDSDLTLGGFLNLNAGQEFNGNGQTGGFATILGSSALRSTDALIRVADDSSFSNSLDLIRGQSPAIAALTLAATAPMVLVESSSLAIGGDLLEWSGGSLAAPGGLLEVNESQIANGQNIQISDYLAHIRNSSFINVGSTPLLTLNNSEATIGGILRLGNSQTWTVETIKDLLALNGLSQLTTTNALVRVEEASTLTSLGTFLEGESIDVSRLSLTETHPLVLVNGSSANFSGNIVSVGTEDLKAPGGILRVNNSPSGTRVSVSDFVVALNKTGTIDLQTDLLPVPFNQPSTPLVHLDSGNLEAPGMFKVNYEGRASSQKMTIQGTIALFSRNGLLDIPESREEGSLVELVNTELNIISLVRFNHQTDSQTIPMDPWISLESSTLANQVAVNSLVRVENQSDLTFGGNFTDRLVETESDISFLNINGLLGVENSQVTIGGDLLHFTQGNTLDLTNWLLSVADRSHVVVNSQLAFVSGGGRLESQTSLVSISSSQLDVLGSEATFEVLGRAGSDGIPGGFAQNGDPGGIGGVGTLRILNSSDAPSNLIGGFNSEFNFSGSLVHLQGGDGGLGGGGGSRGPVAFGSGIVGGRGGDGGEASLRTGDRFGIRTGIGDLIQLFSQSTISATTEDPFIQIIGGAGGNGGAGFSLSGDGGDGGNGGTSILETFQGGLIFLDDGNLSLNGQIVQLVGGNGGIGGVAGAQIVSSPPEAGWGGPGGAAVIQSKETLLQLNSGSDVSLKDIAIALELRGGLGGDRGSLSFFSSASSQFGKSRGGDAIVGIQEGGLLELNNSTLIIEGSFMVVLGAPGGILGHNGDEGLEFIWDLGGKAELHAQSTLFEISDNSTLDIQGTGLALGGGIFGEAFADSAPAFLSVANGQLLDSIKSTVKFSGNFLSLGSNPVRTLVASANGGQVLVSSDNQLLANGYLLELSATSFTVGGSILNLNDTLVAGTATGSGLSGVLHAIDESIVDVGGNVVRLGRGSRLGSRMIDEKLIQATRPLIALTHSNMTTGTVFRISGQSMFNAELQGVLPNDALVSLDASTLTINGSLVGLEGFGSSVAVSGNLVSLTNGSTLTINNGFLVSALKGGTFTLTDGFLVNFGSGANAFNINNGAQKTIDTQFPDLPVSLLGNATIGSTNRNNIRVAPGFDPFSVSGNPAANGGALLEVDGNSTICLGAACSSFPNPTQSVD